MRYSRCRRLNSARAFEREHPDIEIVWEARSLRDFGKAPVEPLADRYAVITVDPFVFADESAALTYESTRRRPAILALGARGGPLGEQAARQGSPPVRLADPMFRGRRTIASTASSRPSTRPDPRSAGGARAMRLSIALQFCRANSGRARPRGIGPVKLRPNAARRRRGLPRLRRRQGVVAIFNLSYLILSMHAAAGVPRRRSCPAVLPLPGALLEGGPVRQGGGVDQREGSALPGG